VRYVTGYGLVVRFVLKAGKEAAFDELMARTVAAIAVEEPGTLVYTVHTVDGQPSQRIFYELYRDLAAFEAHEAQPHTRAFLRARDELVERVEVDFVNPQVSNTAAGAGNA
jgi:quinol monooxygenase YgiN